VVVGDSLSGSCDSLSCSCRFSIEKVRDFMESEGVTAHLRALAEGLETKGQPAAAGGGGAGGGGAGGGGADGGGKVDAGGLEKEKAKCKASYRSGRSEWRSMQGAAGFSKDEDGDWMRVVAAAYVKEDGADADANGTALSLSQDSKRRKMQKARMNTRFAPAVRECARAMRASGSACAWVREWARNLM
jgi:hypothetical protein